MGFSKHEAWPSVYVLKTAGRGTDMCVIVVYVDDLLITGTPIIQSIIKKLKEQVVMDDPTPIGKYLGVMHKVATYDSNSEIVTEVIFDMRVYIKSAVDDYVKRTGWNLKPATSPYAPDLSATALDQLLNEDGEHAGMAASFVMKLLRGWQFRRRSHRWSKDSDRKLYRLYCYLYCYPDLVLMGSLSREDQGHCLARRGLQLRHQLVQVHIRILRMLHRDRGEWPLHAARMVEPRAAKHCHSHVRGRDGIPGRSGESGHPHPGPLRDGPELPGGRDP